AVEVLGVVLRDLQLLARPHAGGEPVDGIAALERPLDQRAPLAHPLDGPGCELHALAFAGHAHDLRACEGLAVESDRHPQTSAAVSAIVSSFVRWSSSEIALPTTDVAKPHWGERANRSSGTKRAACRILAARSSGVSRRGVFVVTRPSTTVLSSGTAARGSKPPERSSSYSSSRRSARMRGKIRSARSSYPPSTSQ